MMWQECKIQQIDGIVIKQEDPHSPAFFALLKECIVKANFKKSEQTAFLS